MAGNKGLIFVTKYCYNMAIIVKIFVPPKPTGSLVYVDSQPNIIVSEI